MERLFEFDEANFSGAGGREWDLAPDGRFLVIKQGAASDDATGSPRIILIQNWFDELQRLVPTP